MIGESSKTTQSDSFMNSDSTATKPGSTTTSFHDKTRKKAMTNFCSHCII
ncbi:hypothetical protein BD408DRAFT_422633 [Parasitella parasitica]|nr:hypothetical protein BD408DRAFT_422633 [Parasitella parasitica]